MRWTTVTLRLALLLAAIIAIWRGLALLPDAHDPTVRILHGALASAAVLATLACLLRADRLPWRVVGHHAAAGNLRAFVLGATLWLLPALVGIAACTALGWSSIRLSSPPSALLAATPALLLGVFLMEALPEELALRGYVQGLLARCVAPWIALLLQAALFTVFAWAAGALASPGQWTFIPCLALILGYVRTLTGNVWACIGVHAAWMTTAQLVSAHMAVDGLQTLQFVAFALLPSATIGVVLGLLRPGFDWRRPAAG